ncbi:MAG: tetratricopeptide repeat protein [Spirochaetales bacterium]|jgi:tetratricopeptide (TPR) repeat protein|nr:tetratricopeptide repeat protein [Spirochaetales bacterium]
MTHFKILCTLVVLLLLSGCVANQTALSDVQPAPVAPEPADPLCGYFYFTWGRMAELSGRLAEAQDAYTKALVCDEHSAYLHQRLAFLLIGMDKKELASIHLEKVLENSPQDNQTRRELAGIFAELGKTEMAISLFNANLEDDPNDSDTYVRLGYLYLRHGYLDKARPLLEKHIELVPHSYAGHVMLAKTYRALEENDLAVDQYKEILDLNWSTLQAYEAAEFYESIGEYDQAIELYVKLVKEDSENETTRRRLAGLYARTNQTDKALAELIIIRSSAENLIDIDLAIGRLMVNGKQYDKAIAHLTPMVQNHPELPLLRPLLALAYHENGDDVAAKKVLSEVGVTSPVYEDATLMYVRICEDNDNVQEGIDVLRRGIKQFPGKYLKFYYLLADLYRQYKQPDLGAQVFAQAVADFPDDYKVRFEYGLYFEKIQQPDRAMEVMLEVLVMAPDDAFTLNYIGYTWADAGENLQQALAYVKRAVELEPTDGFVRDSLGWVYYQMGEYQLAVQELLLATQLQPGDPTIKEHLGDAYMKTGDMEKAAVQYERAVNLFKDAKKRALARQKIADVQGDNE